MVPYLWSIGLLIAKFCPDLPIGRWCQKTLVDAPIALAHKLERKHLIVLLIGAVAMQAFVVTMPMDMAIVATLDVATYLDVLIAVSMFAAFARVRTVSDFVQASVRSMVTTITGKRANAETGEAGTPIPSSSSRA